MPKIKGKHLIPESTPLDRLVNYLNIALKDSDATISGAYQFSNIPKLNAIPSDPKHAVNVEYMQQKIDEKVFGMNKTSSVRVAELGVELTLSGEQTVQGIALTDGDRIGVGGQTDKLENGLYYVRTGAWERTEDFDLGKDISGVVTYVEEGDYEARRIETINKKGNDIVGTSEIQFTVGSGIEHAKGAKGIKKVGDTFMLDEPVLEEFVLTDTDIANKYVDLANTPSFPAEVELKVSNAPEMIYSEDYKIDDVNPNRLTWSTLSLDGLLETGEKLFVKFIV